VKDEFICTSSNTVRESMRGLHQIFCLTSGAQKISEQNTKQGSIKARGGLSSSAFISSSFALPPAPFCSYILLDSLASPSSAP
jgi:hypothetical protein